MKRESEDGCRDVWVFEKFTSFEMSNTIIHSTVDIYKKVNSSCKVNFYEPVDNMDPEINEELMNLHRSNRELVFTGTTLAEVVTPNKSNAPINMQLRIYES